MQILNIGRDSGNQVVLNDNLISRRHAQLIIADNGQVMIKDLNSSNGTYVNGNRITESFLNAGDIVKCGDVFLNWSQFINYESETVQPSTDQQQEIEQPEYREQVYDYAETRYGTGSAFRYLTTRILDIGDLFKTNWKKTGAVLLLMGIPVLITLVISVISLRKIPFSKLSVIPAVLAIFQYAVCPFIAFYLLSFIKKVSLGKVALASGITGFISFCIFFVYSVPQLFNLNTGFSLFNYRYRNDTNLFHVFLIFLLIFAGLCLLISLFIFIYSYYISIEVSRSVSVYLVIATLLINLFFQ
jgi:hypothetical protein